MLKENLENDKEIKKDKLSLFYVSLLWNTTKILQTSAMNLCKAELSEEINNLIISMSYNYCDLSM